ncbi:MAG: hypothetical protein IT458_17480 [Planctomycetes bacterium]|nr:hypothetical protein [Planctomycetota bacterium]
MNTTTRHRVAQLLDVSRILGILVVFTLPALGQTATLQYFGVTCGEAPPFGSPRIWVGAAPRLGTDIAVAAMDMHGVDIRNYCMFQGSAHLVLGVSRSASGGIQLPFLVPFGLTRGHTCFVLVSNELVLSLWSLNNASPGASILMGIPSDPALAGVKLYAQWWISYSTSGPSCPIYMSGWVTSNAVELTLGY